MKGENDEENNNKIIEDPSFNLLVTLYSLTHTDTGSISSFMAETGKESGVLCESSCWFFYYFLQLCVLVPCYSSREKKRKIFFYSLDEGKTATTCCLSPQLLVHTVISPSLIFFAPYNCI